MSRADNTAHLRQAVADRRDSATRRTAAVIAEFDRTGAVVNVAGVANAAGVSRSWLYEQPDLLAAVTQLRERSINHAVSIPSAQRATDESIRRRLDIATAEIERLRTENAALRDQVARTLGEQRLRR